MTEIPPEKFEQIVQLLKTDKSLTEIIILAGVTPQIVARVNRIAKIRKKSTIGNQSRGLMQFLSDLRLRARIESEIRKGELTLEAIARKYKLHPNWINTLNKVRQIRPADEIYRIAEQKRTLRIRTLRKP